MSKLYDTLTQTQNRQLDAHELRLDVDLSPIYPGCFIARDDQGRQGAGRTARLAIESLEKHMPDGA